MGNIDSTTSSGSDDSSEHPGAEEAAVFEAGCSDGVLDAAALVTTAGTTREAPARGRGDAADDDDVDDERPNFAGVPPLLERCVPVLLLDTELFPLQADGAKGAAGAAAPDAPRRPDIVVTPFRVLFCMCRKPVNLDGTRVA